MRTERSSLILGLFALSLLHSPAQGQSIGPAAWIRQAWAEDEFIPMDIAVGPGEEVFVTGFLHYEMDAWFETAPSDSSGSGTPEFLMLDVPTGREGFFVGYDSRDGKVRFAQPGSMLSGDDYGRIGQVSGNYGSGYSVAVVGDRVFHGEGFPLERSRNKGAAMVTVCDLDGEVLHRIGPRETDFVAGTLRIQGLGFDVQGNLYMAGIYRDTLYFSPDIILAPSRMTHPATWDVFVASFAPDGTARWAHHMEDGGMGPLWISLGPYGRAPFDLDAEDYMVLGAKFYGGPSATSARRRTAWCWPRMTVTARCTGFRRWPILELRMSRPTVSYAAGA